MNTPTFDLVEIIKVIQRNFKMILGISISVAIIGAIAYKLKAKSYKAETEVYMTNPLFGDRLNMLRRSVGDSRLANYFGTEGDVDRGMTMIESKDVEDSVVTYCGLFGAYEFDYGNPRDRAKMSNLFRDKFKAKRTENATIICSYEDTDPVRAAKVVDAIVKIADFKFRGYLANIKNNNVKEIYKKVAKLDADIEIFTDSLVALRKKHQIYDLLNPSRQNLLIGAMTTSGKIDAAEGIEIIQNVESVKDQLVMSRSEQIATAYELQSSNLDEVSILHYVSTPFPPNKPSGLGFILTTVASGLAALFFTILLFCFTSYLKAISSSTEQK